MPKPIAPSPTEAALSAGFAYVTHAQHMVSNNALTLGIERVRQATARARETLEWIDRWDTQSPAPPGATPPCRSASPSLDAENFGRDIKRCDAKLPSTQNMDPISMSGSAFPLPNAPQRQILRVLSNSGTEHAATGHD